VRIFCAGDWSFVFGRRGLLQPRLGSSRGTSGLYQRDFSPLSQCNQRWTTYGTKFCPSRSPRWPAEQSYPPDFSQPAVVLPSQRPLYDRNLSQVYQLPRLVLSSLHWKVIRLVASKATAEAFRSWGGWMDRKVLLSVYVGNVGRLGRGCWWVRVMRVWTAGLWRLWGWASC